MVKPIGKGRQRIEMKKIQNKVYLGVTLTKRRRGLFKKASDLISLCGIQLAIILFSPDNKKNNNNNNRVFSFGHPSVFSTVYRFLNHATNYNSQALVHDDRYGEKENESKASDLRARLSEAEAIIITEKKRAKDHKVHDARNDQYNYIQSLELQELAKGLDDRLNWELQRRFVVDMNINPNNFNVGAHSHGENNVFCPNFGP